MQFDGAKPKEHKWPLECRSYLTVLYIIFTIPVIINYRYPLESHFYDILLEICCLLVGLFGIAIRVSAARSHHGERGCLETGGIYSMVRYPQYLGNYFLWLAPVMFLHSLWLFAVYTLVFIIYYKNIVTKDEVRLREQFRAEYMRWAEKTPRFFPKTFRWEKSKLSFSWKSAIRNEYSRFFILIFVMAGLEHLGDYAIKGTFALSTAWTSIFLFSTGVYLFVYSMLGTSALAVLFLFMIFGASKKTKGQYTGEPESNFNPVAIRAGDAFYRPGAFDRESFDFSDIPPYRPWRDSENGYRAFLPKSGEPPIPPWKPLVPAYYQEDSYGLPGRENYSPGGIQLSSYCSQNISGYDVPDYDPLDYGVPDYETYELVCDASGKNWSTPYKSPDRLTSIFNLTCKTGNRIRSDFGNMYTLENTCNFGAALLGAGILANTDGDRNFQRWYHNQTHCSTTDSFSEFSKTFGEGQYFIPATLCAGLTYRYWQERTGDFRPRAAGDFFSRTARGYIVGAPTLLAGQYLLGGGRPGESSHWRPFKDSHGISGHAFMGATPFITAAHMTDNPWGKGIFYALSIIPAWSRVNDDAHYLSQAALGWYLSYLSVRAVSATEGRSPLPKGLTLYPYLEGSGTVGLGFIYKR